MREQTVALATTQRATEGTVVTTLFYVVNALVEIGATDAEVIAALYGLLSSGRVRLIGEFQEHHIRDCWEAA